MNDTKCTAKKFTFVLLAVLLLAAVDQVTKVLAQRFLMEKPFALIRLVPAFCRQNGGGLVPCCRQRRPWGEAGLGRHHPASWA